MVQLLEPGFGKARNLGNCGLAGALLAGIRKVVLVLGRGATLTWDPVCLVPGRSGLQLGQLLGTGLTDTAAVLGRGTTSRLSGKPWEPLCLVPGKGCMMHRSGLQLGQLLGTGLMDTASVPGVLDGVGCCFTAAGLKERDLPMVGVHRAELAGDEA